MANSKSATAWMDSIKAVSEMAAPINVNSQIQYFFN